MKNDGWDITLHGSRRSQPAEPTSFSNLSKEAQNIIGDALLGLFDKTGPPAMTDEVKAEIAGWIGEPEGQA